MTGEPLALDPARPIAAEVKRLAITLADDALRQLQVAEHGPREEAVHESRKRFKELRALLRLVDTTRMRRRARAARRLIRDAGRALSVARDADVLAETFEHLRARFGESVEPSRALQDALVRAASDQVLDTRTAVQLAGRVRNDIALWSLDVTLENVRDGLRASYRAARAAMNEALTSRSAPAFHEWRKREKDHWYQARMVGAILPAMHEREPSLHRLSRFLGDLQDLVLVVEAAAAKSTAEDATVVVNLTIHARQRMRELASEAEILGGEVFALSGRDFRAELDTTGAVVPMLSI